MGSTKQAGIQFGFWSAVNLRNKSLEKTISISLHYTGLSLCYYYQSTKGADISIC